MADTTDQDASEVCIKLVFEKGERKGNLLTCDQARVYMNGELLRGVRRLVFDVDGAAPLPVLKLELLPTEVQIDCPAELRQLLRGRAKVRSVCETHY